MADQKRIGVEHDGFPEATRAKWAASKTQEPISMIVVEYWGDGDPGFGGSADDRALGPDGLILDWQNQAGPQAAGVRYRRERPRGCKADTQQA